MAAYGLYTHIASNKRRSIALLFGLFLLVYILVYAGALVAEALSYQASLQYLLRKAWYDFLAAARRFFNNAVQEYNTGIQQFPAVLLAGPFGFTPKDFFDVGVEERKVLDQAPQVKF